MQRHSFAFLLALTLPVAAWANDGSSLLAGASIGDAPEMPVIAFRTTPRLVMVPGSTVYVVSGDQGDLPCDVFRYGVFWYAYQGEHWYRARTCRGPFMAVEARYVPRAIISVPAKHWRHYPRGEMREWKNRKDGEFTAAREREKTERVNH